MAASAPATTSTPASAAHHSPTPRPVAPAAPLRRAEPLLPGAAEPTKARQSKALSAEETSLRHLILDQASAQGMLPPRLGARITLCAGARPFTARPMGRDCGARARKAAALRDRDLTCAAARAVHRPKDTRTRHLALCTRVGLNANDRYHVSTRGIVRCAATFSDAHCTVASQQIVRTDLRGLHWSLRTAWRVVPHRTALHTASVLQWALTALPAWLLLLALPAVPSAHCPRLSVLRYCGPTVFAPAINSRD